MYCPRPFRAVSCACLRNLRNFCIVFWRREGCQSRQITNHSFINFNEKLASEFLRLIWKSQSIVQLPPRPHRTEVSYRLCSSQVKPPVENLEKNIKSQSMPSMPVFLQFSPEAGSAHTDVCRRLCPNPRQDRMSMVKLSFKKMHTVA